MGRFTSYNSNEKISGLGANETVLELELVLWKTKFGGSIRHILGGEKKKNVRRCLTVVSFTRTNSMRLTTEHRANLISSKAKRMPTQLRGPIPKVMKAYGLRLALFSGAHL